MIEIIKDYYNIDVIGIIMINESVYKIKTETSYYIIKKVNRSIQIELFETIDALNLQCFITIIKNKNNQYMTYFNEYYYYIMPYIELDYKPIREIKIKFYFHTLAYIHQNTCCYKKVSKAYFKDLYNELYHCINERLEYYNLLMNKYEQIDYKSPFQWFYVLNYYKIYQSLCEAKQYLEDYINCNENTHKIRICLNYNNFDYSHICLKNNILISIDHIRYDMPLYDIYNLYKKTPDYIFDIDCFKNEYFNKIEFSKEEHILLNCLISIVPIAFFNTNEIDNIITLTRLLNYLESIKDFIACSH